MPFDFKEIEKIYQKFLRAFVVFSNQEKYDFNEGRILLCWFMGYDIKEIESPFFSGQCKKTKIYELRSDLRVWLRKRAGKSLKNIECLSNRAFNERIRDRIASWRNRMVYGIDKEPALNYFKNPDKIKYKKIKKS